MSAQSEPGAAAKVTKKLSGQMVFMLELLRDGHSYRYRAYGRGECAGRDKTFYALKSRGLVAFTDKGKSVITEAGRAALAAAEGGK